MPKLTSTVPGAIPGFMFRLDVQGLSIGQASKIDGLSSTTDVVTYRGGAEGDTLRKQKGLTQYDDLVIEHIYKADFTTWASLGLVFEPTAGAFGISSPIYKFTIIITLMDHDGNDRVQFFVKNAWIKSYKINNLDANTSAYAIEQLTLAHEGFSRIGVDI